MQVRASLLRSVQTAADKSEPHDPVPEKGDQEVRCFLELWSIG